MCHMLICCIGPAQIDDMILKGSVTASFSSGSHLGSTESQQEEALNSVHVPLTLRCCLVETCKNKSACRKHF